MRHRRRRIHTSRTRDHGGFGRILALLVAAGACAALASTAFASSLDKNAIRDTIRAHKAEIAACYEQTLAADPAAEGRVVLEFTIAPDGGVERAEVAQSSIDDATLHACMMDSAMGWQFAKPAGSGNVVVKYPFVFSAEE